MLEIGDLELTPLQLRDVEASSPSLVSAWLAAASAPEIHSPTGYFLWGLASGELPDVVERDQRGPLIRQAERWMGNAGMFLDREEEVIAELFGRNGKLRHYAEDELLRERMLALWRRLRPAGIEVEHEQRGRASRNAATYFALRRRDEGSEAGAEAAEGPDAGSRGGAATADQGGRAGGDGGPL